MLRRHERLFIALNANNRHRKFIALTGGAFAIYRPRACAYDFSVTITFGSRLLISSLIARLI